MSKALERVIEEQQAEIDQLKARDKYNIEAWVKEHRRREELVSAVFSLLNYPDAPRNRAVVLDAIKSWGYCLNCECSPCECDHDE